MEPAEKMLLDMLKVMREAALSEDQINAYADSKIRADKEARNTGRPEHDLDLVGRILKAGH